MKPKLGFSNHPGHGDAAKTAAAHARLLLKDLKMDATSEGTPREEALDRKVGA